MRGLGEALGIGAVDLDRGELVVFGERDFALRVSAAPEQPLDVHELGDRDLRAEFAAQTSENDVGDVFHGRDDRRVIREQRTQSGLGRCRHSRAYLAESRARTTAAWRTGKFTELAMKHSS